MVRWGRHVPNHDEEMSSRPNGLNAGAGSIQVLVPSDSEREHLISTAAFAIASDGHPVEQKLKRVVHGVTPSESTIFGVYGVSRMATPRSLGAQNPL
jgi:hypothetical protein